ncbi:hypothetical protein QE450_001863 [Paenibacillus sp. SORGH_AS306]|uniref:DUF7832 domain-containing protein n=1 Tax=unclassified Paenibacillus TaxID=185978 RepID=UPI002788B9FE|nr:MULTISPECIES: hypothetical protein [unclassified Paenibacillus]MDQ1234365.1 hypothetical protein [Paenibacillus sp. SORGH_AS_0306]MDR6111411.1 hypothetical protein [Paenibacillus sp. SORGH_AS_0338]
MEYKTELENFLTKSGEKSTQYMHLRLERLSYQSILYIVKGRMLERIRTKRENIEQYKDFKEAQVRVDELIEQLIKEGFTKQDTKILQDTDIKYANLSRREKAYVYDKAKWHYDGDYPKTLLPFQAYIHTGMFVTWLIINNLLTQKIVDQYQTSINLVKQGEMSGAHFFGEYLDGSLSSNDLLEEGNAFARQYLNKDDNLYLADYIDCLASSLPSEYHVQDSLENYKKLEPMINQRYSKFKNFNI